LIHFHQSHYRNYKDHYCERLLPHLCSEFSGWVSYTQFVDSVPLALIPLCAFFRHTCLGKCTGISFIDSSSLDVWINQHIASNNVLTGLAERGKNSTGWFFGSKLHLVINDRGELLNVLLTTGNADDRKPAPKLVRNMFGKVFGDKGHISKELYEQHLQVFGVQLVTKLKPNTKNRLLMSWSDGLLLRKRAIVESVIDQLKNISPIEHSCHRSLCNFLVNLLCGLKDYVLQPKKPSLGREALVSLPV
jgi:hypothetical protein